MPTLIQQQLCEGGKTLERILLKEIKTRDDLEQLYSVLRASVAAGDIPTVEVWTEFDPMATEP